MSGWGEDIYINEEVIGGIAALVFNARLSFESHRVQRGDCIERHHCRRRIRTFFVCVGTGCRR